MARNQICRSCGRDMQANPSGFCVKCTTELSYAELLARSDAREQRDLLQAILIRLEHMNLGTAEVSRLAASIEQLARTVKPQADAFDDIAGEVRRVVKEFERRMKLADEDVEDWRGADDETVQ